jgi:hypothetical protein
MDNSMFYYKDFALSYYNFFNATVLFTAPLFTAPYWTTM